jgi:hypothetical protein
VPAEEAVQLYTGGHWKVPAGLLSEVEHFARLVRPSPQEQNPPGIFRVSHVKFRVFDIIQKMYFLCVVSGFGVHNPDIGK